jgi:hypothetical protein
MTHVHLNRPKPLSGHVVRAAIQDCENRLRYTFELAEQRAGESADAHASEGSVAKLLADMKQAATDGNERLLVDTDYKLQAVLRQEREQRQLSLAMQIKKVLTEARVDEQFVALHWGAMLPIFKRGALEHLLAVVTKSEERKRGTP